MFFLCTDAETESKVMKVKTSGEEHDGSFCVVQENRQNKCYYLKNL